MHVEKDVLCLTKQDIDNFCKDCGSCCTELVFWDKVEIFFSSGRLVTLGTASGKVCKYWKGNCSIQENKPKCCVKWNCGVVEMLRQQLKEVI